MTLSLLYFTNSHNSNTVKTFVRCIFDALPVIEEETLVLLLAQMLAFILPIGEDSNVDFSPITSPGNVISSIEYPVPTATNKYFFPTIKFDIVTVAVTLPTTLALSIYLGYPLKGTKQSSALEGLVKNPLTPLSEPKLNVSLATLSLKLLITKINKSIYFHKSKNLLKIIL